MSEIFVYAEGNMLFKAYCRELEGKETSLREIIKERMARKKEVKEAVLTRKNLALPLLSPMPPPINKQTAQEGKTEPARRIFKYFYEREAFDNTSRN